MYKLFLVNCQLPSKPASNVEGDFIMGLTPLSIQIALGLHERDSNWNKGNFEHKFKNKPINDVVKLKVHQIPNWLIYNYVFKLVSLSIAEVSCFYDQNSAHNEEKKIRQKVN